MQAGARLRAARLEAGLTQRELGTRAGVPQSTVARIEASLMDPRVGTLERLLRECDAELVVVERPGRGVDRTLIQARLSMTAVERMDRVVEEDHVLGQMREKARRVS